MPDFLVWPAVALIAIVAIGIAALVILRPALLRLVDRISKAGPKGLTFERQQTEEKPPAAPTYEELMNGPVSATVLSRVEKATRFLEGLSLKSDEQKLALALRASALSRVEMEFTNISSIIFGSQLEFLVRVAGAPGGVLRAEAETAFQQAQAAFPDIHANRTVDDWLKYLFAVELLETRGNNIDITQYGKDFLKFLVDARQTYQRNG
jgi:hypothetical protein